MPSRSLSLYKSRLICLITLQQIVVQSNFFISRSVLIFLSKSYIQSSSWQFSDSCLDLLADSSIRDYARAICSYRNSKRFQISFARLSARCYSFLSYRLASRSVVCSQRSKVMFGSYLLVPINGLIPIVADKFEFITALASSSHLSQSSCWQLI